MMKAIHLFFQYVMKILVTKDQISSPEIAQYINGELQCRDVVAGSVLKPYRLDADGAGKPSFS